MVSLPYTHAQPRHRRAAASRNISKGFRLNWRLLVGLAINVVVWVGVVRLLGQFL